MTFASSSVLMILRIIAIWNRNKVVVALATILWVVNVSFLIYGKSLFTRPADELKLSQTWILTRHHSDPPCMGSGATGRLLQYGQSREQ